MGGWAEFTQASIRSNEMRLEQKGLTFKLSRGDSPSLHLIVLEQIHHHCVQRLGIAALCHGHLLEFGHVAGQGSPGVAAVKEEKEVGLDKLIKLK